MGWSSVLKALGGWPGIVSLGAEGFQTANAIHAENSAKNQLQNAATQQLGVYAPYNELGLQAGNSLAAALGLQGLPAGVPTGDMTGRTADGWPIVPGHAVPRTPDTPMTTNVGTPHSAPPTRTNPLLNPAVVRQSSYRR